MNTNADLTVILASESRYKQALVHRLVKQASAQAAEIDETPSLGESPPALAARLAMEKAKAVHQPVAQVTIGADQVAALGDQPIGKPLSLERNIEMLESFSGQTLTFHTAATLLGPGSRVASHVDQTFVHFHSLSRAEIERYVHYERALDCAGGFKIESAGPALIRQVDNVDPTALIGLPLLWLAGELRALDLAIPC